MDITKYYEYKELLENAKPDVDKLLVNLKQDLAKELGKCFKYTDVIGQTFFFYLKEVHSVWAFKGRKIGPGEMLLNAVIPKDELKEEISLKQFHEVWLDKLTEFMEELY